ncbi:MAG: hypothetical protein KDA91_05905 [Planctomycetaceae bacterium]|nr:hypothetical protein [Planctomycetaceae bacterium]
MNRANSTSTVEVMAGKSKLQRLFPRVSCYLVNGMLVMWGIVGSEAMKLQAEEMAWSEFSVESIVNQLQIEGAREDEPQG